MVQRTRRNGTNGIVHVIISRPEQDIRKEPRRHLKLWPLVRVLGNYFLIFLHIDFEVENMDGVQD